MWWVVGGEGEGEGRVKRGQAGEAGAGVEAGLL